MRKTNMTKPRPFVRNYEKLKGQELTDMRKSCALASECLASLASYVRPGVTTGYLNEVAHEWILSHGAYPAPLGYPSKLGGAPFPKSICTSVNDVVCHGIPSDQTLKEGDIVNVDVTTNLNGYFGDTSRTFMVGQVTASARELVATCESALEAAIQEVKAGARIGNIGAAIQSVTESRGFSVVTDYVGHGVGKQFHQPPVIRHFGTRGAGDLMEEGMIFTIEPMINMGGPETVLLEDRWTAVTADGSRSAQFEHTIRVTSQGYEILTTRPD